MESKRCFDGVHLGEKFASKMSKVQTVRALVEQRLTAAAEEIFGLFERTIAEYEEELCRSKEENERQQKLLDAVFNPQLQLHRADAQQLSVSKDVVPSEQQERSCSLDQEDPEPPHIKEEQEELWSSQEGEQLPRLEEADLKIPFTSVLVKSEYEEEEEAQPSQIHEKTEEKREAEDLETESDGEDCGGSELNTNSNPDSPREPATDDEMSDFSEPETDDSGDWEDAKEPQSGLNSSQNNEGPDLECNTGKTSVRSSEGAESFDHEGHLQKNNVTQTEEKPFSCSVCSETFSIISSLTLHLKEHSDGKRFTCSVCKLSFDTSSNLVRHVRIHTGEKPFSCSVCGQRFTLKQHLKYHFVVHGGEKPFKCSICGKSFYRKDSLVTHMRLHSVGKYFSCSVCETSFGSSNSLLRHMRIHTGEKPFSCSVCGKGFAQKGDLGRHVQVHTGEKPHSCSVCGKSFVLHSNLRQHLTVHTGEKPFTCSICNKRFTRLHNVKKHKCVGESSTSK